MSWRTQLWRQRLQLQLIESILRLTSVRFTVTQPHTMGTSQFIKQSLHQGGVQNAKSLGQFRYFQSLKHRRPIFCAFAACCTSTIQKASHVATNE